MSDRLYAPETELTILGLMLADPSVTGRVVSELRSEMFSTPENRLVFEAASSIYARGDQPEIVLVQDELKRRGKLEEVGGLEHLVELLEMAPGMSNPTPHARIVKNRWTAREMLEMLERASYYLREKNYPDGGRKLADTLAMKLIGLYASSDADSQRTRHELMDELWMDAMAGDGGGVALPWPSLNDEIGPLVAGEIVGLSAYSGGGKSTVAANLVDGLASADTPAIVFATEMGKRWAARMAAARSRTSQKCAEKNDWSAFPTGLGRYQRALEEMKKLPVEFVTTPNVTPAEVVNRTRVLRRLYSGKTVVVVVDHLHRLDYGGQDPGKMVGQVTRMLKNAAGEDRDGGLVFILLYQPRKPDDIEVPDRPVRFHAIRGDGLVGNELDIHISPFRTWVKSEVGGRKTPWGSPLAILDKDGLPIPADPPKPGELKPAGIKLCDEHVFIAPDKRRIDGPGRVVVLNFHRPSGRISEEKGPDQYQLDSAA